MKTYGVGTQVFCDFFFGGKPKGKVVEIVKPGNGRNTVSGKNLVKITENHKGYKKGEIVGVNSWQCVPLTQKFLSGIFIRINTDFEWL